MPRGGKRPGAGAPRGNLNAFRSGKYSLQLSLVLSAGKMKDFRHMSRRIAQVRAKKRARASAASAHQDSASR